MNKNRLFAAPPQLLVLSLVLVLCAGCTKKAKEARYFKEAEQFFKAGEYDKAKIDYIKVLQLNSKNAIAFARLGHMWLDEGAPLRAGAFLKQAEELAPKDADNRLRLARVYQVIGKLSDAKKEVLAVLQQDPSKGEALVALTEMARTPEEISAAGQAVEKFPDKKTAAYELASANIALRKRDLAGAKAAISQAVALDPKSPEAHQAKGILNLLEKNTKAAGEEFKAAADLAPARSNFQMTYAEYKRQTEGAEAATAFLKNVTKKAPDYLPAWISLGRIGVGDKKYDQALADLENVFSRDPENIDARLLQSDIFLTKHEADKAVTELEKLDKAYPGLPMVKYRLAQADLQQNKPTDAANALDQAITANPNYTEAILLRAELNLRTGHVPPAVSALEDLVNKHPDLKPAQLLLADAYRAAGRLDDAATIFKEQIKATPKVPDPYFFLGLIQQQQKKDDEARKSYEKALELSPDNLLAISQLIDLDLQAKDFAAATARAQEQMKKHPKSAAPYLLEGKVEMAQGHWMETETAAKKALELDANSGPAYDMLVRSYLATNKLPEAAHELETVLTKAPQNQSALMTLATIREQQKDYPKARDAYEKLLAINPKFVPALNNLSYLDAEKFNQPDKAYELAQKARTLDPGNPAIADTLGWASYKRGDYQQALALLQESAGKAGTNPEIQFHLGMAHYMMGQTDAARDAFQKAIAATGDFPSKAEAESRLKLLGAASGGAAGEIPVAQLESMLKRQPNDLVVQLRLAEAYEKQGASAKAAEAYEAALKVNPKLPSATLKLAQLYSGPIPNKEKALAYAKQARALSPNDPKVTGVLGQIAFATGDFSWASNLLQESARQLDTDPKVLHDLAWATYSLGNVPDARDAMERSLKASPDSAATEDAKTFLALTALEGNPTVLAAAKAEISSKLKADPAYVPALMADAALDAQNNNKTAAENRYQEVLQRFPDFAPAQTQLASLYADDPARISEAYDLASKARKVLPEDPAVSKLLGRLSYEKKDYSRAIQFLQESARNAPLDAEGLYYLGMSQMQANQKPAGRETLSQALAKGLENRLSVEAKRALSGPPKTK